VSPDTVNLLAGLVVPIQTLPEVQFIVILVAAAATSLMFLLVSACIFKSENDVFICQIATEFLSNDIFWLASTILEILIFQATSNLAQGLVVPIQTLSLNVFTPHIVSAPVVCTNQEFVFTALSQVLVQLLVPVISLVIATVPSLSGSIYVLAAVTVEVNKFVNVFATFLNQKVQSKNVLSHELVCAEANTMSHAHHQPVSVVHAVLSHINDVDSQTHKTIQLIVMLSVEVSLFITLNLFTSLAFEGAQSVCETQVVVVVIITPE